MTIEIHQEVPHAILGLRLDAGPSASKDGVDPRDNLADTLAAHDQVYILIIFFKTFFIEAGHTSLLHRDDRNSMQYSHPTEFGDRIGATVKNN